MVVVEVEVRGRLRKGGGGLMDLYVLCAAPDSSAGEFTSLPSQLAHDLQLTRWVEYNMYNYLCYARKMRV